MATAADAKIVQELANDLRRLAPQLPERNVSQIIGESELDPDLHGTDPIFTSDVANVYLGDPELDESVTTPPILTVSFPDERIQAFKRAGAALAKDLGTARNLSSSKLREAGLFPSTTSQSTKDNVEGVIADSVRTVAAWHEIGSGKKSGFGTFALVAGLGIGVLLLLRKKPEGALTGSKLDEVPFGALSSKSRSMRVGLMGGIAGLGALGGSKIIKDSVFGPIVGGALGATAFAALASEKFEINLVNLALYGGASGLAGSLASDQLTSDSKKSNPFSYFARAGAGAFFGGAGASLGVDGVVPPELKVRDDLTAGDAPAAEISEANMPLLADGVSLVGAEDIPDTAIDTNGFVDL